MNPTPRPVELKLLKSAQLDFNDHRNVFCRQYANCLNTALRQQWEDFSCRSCELSSHNATPTTLAYALEQPRNHSL
jgi:hypothetical protein